jgi:hypothetical protein
MNGRILIAVGIAIVIITATTIYLEQKESKVTTVNVPVTNVTQSTSQAPTFITFITDKSSYNMGDTIVISGVVKSAVTGTPITILILDPNNLLLQAERVLVSTDGTFHTTIMTTPSTWKLDGTYAASAQYGAAGVKAQTTFNFAT